MQSEIDIVIVPIINVVGIIINNRYTIKKNSILPTKAEDV